MSSRDALGRDASSRHLARQDMEKYGITCVPVLYFHYKDFKYSTLGDAISQARRDIRGDSFERVGPR